MDNKVIVLKEFRDIDNFDKLYKEGEVLAISDDERVKSLVERELVRVVEDEAKEVDLSANAQIIISSVKSFSDIEKLKEYLSLEKESEKPRNTVVEAIEKRLLALESKQEEE